MINNPTSTTISASLRDVVIKAINGGVGIDPVTIIAMKRSEIKTANPDQRVSMGLDNIAFDMPPANIAQSGNNLPNAVDMSDFNAINDAPLLQSALFAHIIVERMQASQGWDAAHKAGNQAELSVIQEKDPMATMRNDQSTERNLRQTSSFFQEVSDGFVYDYGTTEFTTHMKNTTNGVVTYQNPNEIVGVKKTK